MMEGMGKGDAGWQEKHVVVFGSDEFRVKERATEILQKVAPDDPLNLEVIDGQVDLVDQAVAKVDQVREAMMTRPFFGGKKVVYFKHVTFMGDSREGRSPLVQEALERLLETVKACPPAEVQLVVSALALDRRRTFAKQLEVLAHVERFDLIDLRGRGGEEAVQAEVRRALAAQGLTAEEAAVERLTALVGNETRTMVNEVEKLALYLYPETRVTADAVREIVPATRDLAVWDLCDAAAEGRVREAVGLLRQVLAQGENEIGVLAMLANHFRLMAVCRVLEEAGDIKLAGGKFPEVRLSERAKDLLPRTKSGESPKPFRIAKVLQQGKKRSRESVLRALETLYRTYWTALSGGADRARGLEAGVLELCRLD